MSSGRVVVLGQLDAYANGAYAGAVVDTLRRWGHDVRLVDTSHLSRAGSSGWRRRVPATSPLKILLFLAESVGAALTRCRLRAGRPFFYHVLHAELALRRRLLRPLLPPEGDVDLLVCETPQDAPALLDARVPTFYHCPTPWADELMFEGRLTSAQHLRLRRWEANLMDSVDYLGFHWHTYARYAVREYRLRGHNVLVADGGCVPAEQQARFATPARIVYLGSLGSHFVDLPLLARLGCIFPIDVYGGPPPDPALGLNYLGWSEPVVLAGYQFGLITCTDDPLRREGFSAKHLEYFAHGLPVLVPEWRRDESLADGSLPFSEQSFAAVVAHASTLAQWAALHEAAQAQAQRYSWKNGLADLDALLRGGDQSAAGG